MGGLAGHDQFSYWAATKPYWPHAVYVHQALVLGWNRYCTSGELPTLHQAQVFLFLTSSFDSNLWCLLYVSVECA